MKTVHDAIIHYNGSNFVRGKNGPHHTHIICGRGTDRISTAYASDIHSGLVICSISAYNAEVDYLASNMGRATQSYGEYKKEFECMTTATIQSKPVFTQAMADAGERPSIGMNCLIEVGGTGALTEFTPEYFGRKYVVGYWPINEREASFAIDALKFKPLTPPITLIHGKVYQFELSFGDYRVGYYREDGNSFFDGLLCANKICGKSEASNIELLTVDAK